MPDTRRTVASLQSLLADNSTGAVSPQDERDFLVSTAPAYGSCHWTTAAATTISAQSTKAAIIDGNNYVKAAGTTTVGALVKEFDMPASNRLRYTGAPTLLALVVATVSLTAATANDNLGVKIALNGTVQDASFVPLSNVHNSNVSTVAVACLVQLATNDYVEVFLANETAGRNATIQAGRITAQSILV